ncbi:MAG TPA: hypothetical protein VHY22_18845, partial [Chthoniobacteraceae bacterium]|nr:hypothetical protein [Chthoniobacteraceae bacterium]
MKTANNRSAPPLQGEESRRGIALVITLAFIVIITILVVGLSSLLRVERPAANTNFEKRRAALLAAKGTDEVVGALDQFAGDPNRYWISQPGQLIVSNTNGSHALLAIVPLNSGSVQISSSSSPFTGASAVYRPPDLNIIDLSGTSHLISNDVTSGSPVTMPVAWIYIHQDGVESTSDPVTGQPATNDPSSPLVGRYAYWADDESSKINYNMAWGRAGDPTFPVPNQAWAGDQTNINLCALQDSTFSVTPSIANAIHTFIVPDAVSGDPLWKQVGTFFNTPREAQGTGGAPSAALDHFKSDVTNYNHDPDTTFFNQPRIVLTTRPDRAGWTWNGTAWVGKNGQSGPPDANGNITPTTGTPPYLEILNYEGNQNGQQAVPTLSGSCDPGIIADLSLTKMNATVNLLMNYLKRTDWPMMGATGTNSFQAKYYTVGGAGALYSSSNQVVRLAQMAINIIDYVRCAESPDPLVVPLRAWNVTASGTTIDLTSITGPPSGNEQDSYLGAARGPYFTQVAVWCPPSGKYPYVRIEIYNPAEYNIPAISPSQLGLSVEPATDGGGRFVGN